ncbi:hypothetical protein [Thioclava sp. GXIMD4216]|uniref:hypothetical protein n=1 Tax=Thioclava sp. GXIMD4216 TaxID=3131929 RepID=UPI0030CCFA1F
MAKPTLTPAPNDPPILGSPTFAADAQGFLGWFPVMGQYMQDMGDWIETMIGDVPSENIAAFAHLTGAANKLPYFTGAGAMAMADLTADGRSLLSQSGALKVAGGLASGTAVTQSKFDQTTGRLLKAGDNGILGPVVNATAVGITSLDDAPIGSLINCYPIATNLPGSASIGFVRTMAIDNGNICQEFTPIYPTSALRQRYFRHRMFGVWTGWTAMHPEYGSNANGNYVRLPDGTQICHARIIAADAAWATAQGAVYRQDTSNTWTYPAAFFDNSNLTITGSIETGTTVVGGMTFNGVGATSANYRAWSVVAMAAGSAKIIHLKAIGRWK